MMLDAGLIDIIITAVTFVLVAGVSWAAAYFRLPKRFTAKIEVFLKEASVELKKAIDEDSKKGRAITRSEIYNGLVAAFQKTFGNDPKNLKNIK